MKRRREMTSKSSSSSCLKSITFTDEEILVRITIIELVLLFPMRSFLFFSHADDYLMRRKCLSGRSAFLEKRVCQYLTKFLLDINYSTIYLTNNFHLHASRNPSARSFVKSSRSSLVYPAVLAFDEGLAKSILWWETLRSPHLKKRFFNF